MAKRIIELTVDREYVSGSGVVIGAAGSHDDVTLQIEFGDLWIGYNIYATFRDALGEHPTITLLTSSMLAPGKDMTYLVDVPAAAKLCAGRSMLTLSGYSLSEDGSEEDSATNTATAYFRVLQSDFALADDGSVEATLAQQLQNELREHEETVQSQIEGHRTEVGEAVRQTEANSSEAIAISNEAINIARSLRAEADAGAFKGDKGDKGDKYTLTEEDKDELVLRVMAALPNGDEVSY